MIKASPVQMRKALQIVDALKSAGIRFVPMPVLDEDDFVAKTNEMLGRLALIELRADAYEKQAGA